MVNKNQLANNAIQIYRVISTRGQLPPGSLKTLVCNSNFEQGAPDFTEPCY